MSEQEMTPEDQEDYGRLCKLATRIDKPYVLSEGLEIAEIIRRQLFEELGSEEERTVVTKSYAAWIEAHREYLPSWFPIDNAKENFEATYPFHPTVLTVFKRKWQTLPKFQRTRGILRILALWISKAYRTDFLGAHRNQMITLGTAPLEDGLFRAEVFQQLGESRLEGAMSSDIVGVEAHATRLDMRAPDTIKGARLHRRVASAIFFESAGGQVRTESTEPEIRLAVGKQNLDLGNIETVLENLTNTCYFLTVDGNRYRFNFVPNLNKLLADRGASIRDEDLIQRMRDEIERVISKGPDIRQILFPERTNDIPNHPTLTVVALAPELGWKEELRTATQSVIDKFTKEYGTSVRTFKSALIWMIADDPNLIKEHAKQLLALEALEAEQEKLHLAETQRHQLKQLLKYSEKELQEAVWQTYHNVLLLNKDNSWKRIDLGLVHSSAADSLIGLILTRLKQEGDLEDSISPNFLVRNWPPALKEWSTKDIRDTFYASPRFPRLFNANSLKETISRGVKKGLFAYTNKSLAAGLGTVFFKEELPEKEVEISEDTILIPKTLIQDKKSLLEEKTLLIAETTQALPKIDGQTPRAITSSPITASTGKTSSERIVGISWEGEVPAQKWMTFYTQVLSRFAVEEKLQLQVKVVVEASDTITKQKLEETLSGLRRMGLPDQLEIIKKDIESSD